MKYSSGSYFRLLSFVPLLCERSSVLNLQWKVTRLFSQAEEENPFGFTSSVASHLISSFTAALRPNDFAELVHRTRDASE